MGRTTERRVDSTWNYCRYADLIPWIRLNLLPPDEPVSIPFHAIKRVADLIMDCVALSTSNGHKRSVRHAQDSEHLPAIDSMSAFHWLMSDSFLLILEISNSKFGHQGTLIKRPIALISLIFLLIVDYGNQLSTSTFWRTQIFPKFV